MSIEPKIYVADLAAYNSGFLHGCWIDANQDLDDIQEQIQNMLRKSPEENAEEYAIHDYEGFGKISISDMFNLHIFFLLNSLIHLKYISQN